MAFVTSIHCMDGRIQWPLLSDIMKLEQVQFVDVITEASPCKILSERLDEPRIQAIRERLDLSLAAHNSSAIYISGHHDCAANPVTHDEQIQQIADCVHWLQQTYQSANVFGLWVNRDWQVRKVVVDNNTLRLLPLQSRAVPVTIAHEGHCSREMEATKAAGPGIRGDYLPACSNIQSHISGVA